MKALLVSRDLKNGRLGSIRLLKELRFLMIFLVLGVANTSFALKLDPVEEIEAHLFLEDFRGASLLAKQAYDRAPEDLSRSSLYAQSLLQNLQEAEALRILPHIYSDLVEPYLEDICWALIKNGVYSSHYPIKATALICAHLGQDAKGVEMIVGALEDPSASIRSLAIQLCGTCLDAKVQDRLMSRLQEEREWWVKLDLIRIMGKLKVAPAKPYLEQILLSKRSTREEWQVALTAYEKLLGHIDYQEVSPFLKSPHLSLRCLGIELSYLHEIAEAADLIFPLLQDPISDVRLFALKAWGLFFEGKKGGEGSWLNLLLEDSDPRVAIEAAFIGLLMDHQGAPSKMSFWLTHPKEELRYLAVSKVVIAGTKGESIAREMIAKSPDPFVRINLAIALFCQRRDLAVCLEAVLEFLKHEKQALSLSSQGLLQLVYPARNGGEMASLQYREAEDQMARLHLLSLLAMLDLKLAKAMIREFLLTTNWQVTGAAAVFLLQQGGDGALELIRDLLKDDDPNLKLQAALILAFLAKDEESASILETLYLEVDMEKRAQILEALGAIGDQRSVPFLYKGLFDPSQRMRLIAASSLIRCLHH